MIGILFLFMNNIRMFIVLHMFYIFTRSSTNGPTDAKILEGFLDKNDVVSYQRMSNIVLSRKSTFEQQQNTSPNKVGKYL